MVKKNKEEVVVRAVKIVANQLKINLLGEGQYQVAFKDLGADQFDIIELIIKFEDAFRIRFDDDSTAKQIKTINDVVEYVLNS